MGEKCIMRLVTRMDMRIILIFYNVTSKAEILLYVTDVSSVSNLLYFITNSSVLHSLFIFPCLESNKTKAF